MSDRETTRRELLASAGAVAVGAGLAGRARAEAPARGDLVPSHATIEYDEDMLLKYRPRLQFSADEYSKFLNLYGWVATSTALETDVCVYWAEYTHQEGVSEYDSHDGDHEPIYVFVRDGTVDKVVYSAYHWLRATSYAPALDGTHPLFRVISPWHQYTRTDTPGRLTTIGDLTQVFDQWLEGGLEESIAPGAVVNPWIMARRPHWWRRGTFGLSWDAMYVELLYTLGAHKAGDSDNI
ncbi:hypothetical protein [Halosimplex pelagicum]|uniref:Uncharacterized protein n=1 Tax=Halosimplex pelagicum TaxID=869886 RepID=A0A7D5PB00_9EURY|nr:hypothetical protein [Halosimplex pelagicum]QLH83404.1 hypothetical protein HZS54_17975 [Halosimplex pelagicum]